MSEKENELLEFVMNDDYLKELFGVIEDENDKRAAIENIKEFINSYYNNVCIPLKKLVG